MNWFCSRLGNGGNLAPPEGNTRGESVAAVDADSGEFDVVGSDADEGSGGGGGGGSARYDTMF